MNTLRNKKSVSRAKLTHPMTLVAAAILGLSAQASAQDITAKVSEEANLLPDVKTELYSETGYLEREDVVFNATHANLKVPLAYGISLFGQAGNSYSQDGSTGQEHDYSHVYAGAGFDLKLGSSSFARATARRRAYRDDASGKFEKVDLRLLFVSGQEFHRASLGTKTAWFNSYYGELLINKTEIQNTVAAGYIRSGLEYDLTRPLRIQLYIEPFITRDQAKLYYNNRYDLRFASAATGSIPLTPLTYALSYARVAHQYEADFFDANTALPQRGWEQPRPFHPRWRSLGTPKGTA